jgi:hypothetical protein
MCYSLVQVAAQAAPILMQRRSWVRFWGPVLALGGVVAALPGCSASNDVASCTSKSCPGYPLDEAGAQPIESSTTFDIATPVDDSGPTRSLLCGTTGCFPGNRSACGVNPSDAAGYDIPASDANDGASEAADAAPSDVAHDAQDGTLTEITDGAVSTDGSEPFDAPLDMGSTDEPRVSQSCYILPAEAGPGVVTQCAPVGQVGEGGACEDSSDCIGLYGCVDVGDDDKGVCRAVSCALPIICPPGFFYRRASLRVNGATRGNLQVPVCVPNERCTPLSTPNPCTKPLEECAVVGSQGETGCVIPGPRKQGETCDEDDRCAHGLLCSKFNNQCVRLCHVAADVSECAGGSCQGGNQSIPDGFGICVGEIPDASP